MGKDYKIVEEELTPVWWEEKQLTDDSFIVIPDTQYDNEVEGFNYGDGVGADTDFLTGVIVKAPKEFRDKVGFWCHYRAHGPIMFHPFRARFSNGKKSPIEQKAALFIRRTDITLITDKKLF